MNKDQTNEKLLQDVVGSKCFHCRKLIEMFLASSPQINSIFLIKKQLENGEIEKTGDIAFTVTLESMGLSRQTFTEHEKAFSSNFVINFFGEFLVRENISQFVGLVMGVDSKEFIQAISTKNHRTFGVKIQGSAMTFIFHISLLSNILTEELKNIDWQ